MQSSMLYNQRFKQHFKLSKSSLNKKNVKHIDPKQTLLHTCATCVTFDGPQNNPYICLGL